MSGGCGGLHVYVMGKRDECLRTFQLHAVRF